MTISLNIVIFDIDGTLANCDHRLHYVQNGNTDWLSFFETMYNDTPYPNVVKLLHSLAEKNVIILTTGRPEDHRSVTVEWLAKHGIPYTDLFMRPSEDYRPDHEIKREMLEEIRKIYGEPWFVVDDRDSVVKMWRTEGLTCLQAATWADRRTKVREGTLILMVGPSGAGKSTWLIDNSRGYVISSDEMRYELTGNFQDQSQNEAVFDAVHDLARTRLRHGLDTVIDATHLRRKDRLASVACAEGGPVKYIVIDRPMEDKRRDGGWRNALDFDLIGKHDQTFRSQLKDILAGDGLPNVTVRDLRITE